MARLDLELNGKAVTPPKDWREVGVLMTWDNSSVQANITTDNFTLVKDAATEVFNWLSDGFNGSGNGYFQGIPAKISVSEGNNSKTVFDGFTDNKTFVDKTPNDTNIPLSLEIGFKNNDQIINFKKRAAGLTFDVVKKEGFLTNSMIEELLYVKQKPFDPVEALGVAVQTTILTLKLIQLVKDSASLIVNSVAHITGGLPGIAAGAVYSAAATAIQIIAVIADLVALVAQINQLIKIFFPFPRKVKVVSLYNLAKSSCEYLGYEFNSSIAELKRWYILPTLTQALENKAFVEAFNDKGYFTQSDSGFIVGDFFKNLEKITGGKFQVIDKIANFESLLNDNYWLNNATANFKMPSTFIASSIPNGDEINATTFVSFADDQLDDWTRQNLTGTFATEVVEHINLNDPIQDQLDGLNKIELPYALGNQKETQNFIETVIGGFFQLLSKIGQVFGQQPTQLAEAYKHIKEALKISGDFTSRPKLLSLTDAQVENQPFKVLASNHRSDLNASRILDLNAELSAVRNNYRAQWITYKNVRIPFGFSDFITIGNNNYFLDINGDTARMDRVEWTIGQDAAVCDFRIRKPYDKNLKSTILTGDK